MMNYIFQHHLQPPPTPTDARSSLMLWSDDMSQESPYEADR